MSDLGKRLPRPRPLKGEPPGSWSRRLGEWRKEQRRDPDQHQEPHKFEGLRTEVERAGAQEQAQEKPEPINALDPQEFGGLTTELERASAQEQAQNNPDEIDASHPQELGGLKTELERARQEEQTQVQIEELRSEVRNLRGELQHTRMTFYGIRRWLILLWLIASTVGIILAFRAFA